MRNSAIAVSAVAVLALGLAGCDGDDEEPATDPTPGAEGTSPEVTGEVAACVAGDWRSTGVGEQNGDTAAGFELVGGAGVALSIDPTGETDLDFTDMDPISFTGSAAEVTVDGEMFYAGPATGWVRTDPDQPAGQWEPTEPADWSAVRITVDLTEPIDSRPVDDLPVGNFVEQADEFTGDVVDVEPVLGGGGSYECGDDTLVLTPDQDTQLTWTFAARD